jgi:hypothetical protein
MKPALLTTYAVVIAILLSSIQFLPGYYYSTESSVRVYREKSWTWATSWSMHEEEAFSQLIPEFCGISFPRLTHPEAESYKSTYWGKNYFKADSDAVGVSAIFLALLSVFLVRRRETYFFAGLSLFSFIYALGATTPLFKYFYDYIPLVDMLRAPSKIIFIFSFCVSLLAGFTIQSLILKSEPDEKGPNKGLISYLIGFPAFLLAVASTFLIAGKEALIAWTSVFFPDAIKTVTGEEYNKLVLAIQNVPEIVQGAFMSFTSTAIIAVIFILALKKTRAAFLACLIFLIPLFDGVRFNRHFIEVIDPKEHFVPNELVKFLKSQTDDFRVLNRSHDLPRSLLPQHGIELVTGYHGNQLRWYDDLLGGPHFKNRSNPRYLNLVGTRHLIVPANSRLKEDYFGEIPARTVFYFGWDQVIRNDNAQKRTFLVNHYRVFNHRVQIPETIMKGDEDVSRIVYLESLPEVPIPPDSLGSDSCWTIAKSIDSVVVGLRCTSNRLLVLMDNYYDCWHATADGEPIEILRAYSSFRAVAVPAGTKEVKFKYKSSRYETGKLLTTVTSLFLLGVFAFHVFKNFKKNHLSYRNSTPN